MEYMRSPTLPLPQPVQRYWTQIQAASQDDVWNRLSQPNFQEGHMLAMYWHTVVRWMRRRAIKDAQALKEPLIVIQAADR